MLTLNDLDWVYTDRGEVLHHATFDEVQAAEMDDYASAFGALDCRPYPARHVSIPGMFSRMGMKRCDRCSDLNGYPRGVGSPKNDAACRAILSI